MGTNNKVLFSVIASLFTALAATQDQPTIRTTASEVVLDLVVRDKREQFVRNLKAEDIEIREDGLLQKIKAFRFVDGSRPAPAGAAAQPGAHVAEGVKPRAAINPLREINLVSIVFGMIGSEDRVAARDSARLFVENELRPNTFVGVFSLDYRLNILQPFTNDAALINAGIDRFATGAYSEFLKTSLAFERGMSVPTVAAPGAVGILGSSANAGFEQTVLAGASPLAGVPLPNGFVPSMILGGNHMDLGYHESVRALLTILDMFRAQAGWPGRKTVMFFSYGVPVSPEIKDLFRALISTANRAGVTVYGLDVRRLVSNSARADSREGPRVPISTAPTGLDAQAGAAYAEGGYGGLFRPDYVGQSDPLESLRELAESTGGFLIHSTNRPSTQLRRVMEEVGTHYELAYTPVSNQYDGRFRSISLKLGRPGLKVQTRKGYYALPSLEGRPLLPFETMTLSALGTQPLPHDFEYHASAIRFRPGPAIVQHVLAFEVPASGLTIVEDKKAKICRTRVSFTALIKAAGGHVVDKISGDVPYSAPIENAARVRRGSVTFTASVDLPPGRYTLETAALDRENLKVSARRSVLFVPPGRAAGVSELTLALRAVPVAQPNPDNPLESPAGKITPALGGRVQSGSDVLLYAVVYPEKASAETPQMKFELAQQGKTVVAGNALLRPADETGAIPVLASFPSSKLAPGEYEARAIFRQGNITARESTFFRIE